MRGTSVATKSRGYRNSVSQYPTMRATSLVAAVMLLATAPLSGCGQAAEGTSSPSEAIRLTVWKHEGAPEERDVLAAQVDSFDEVHPELTIDLTVIDSQEDYNDALQAAIASDRLPDVLEVDGPYIASYAYQSALTPLDDLLSPQVQDRMLSSLRAQGTWHDHLWAVGAFDSGLAMWGDRSQLEAAGVRIPQGLDDAWSATEMTAALDALAANDPDGKVLDLQLNDMPFEFVTYATAPLLYSAGAALVDPETGLSEGTLDSPSAVDAITDLSDWATYADPNEDGTALPERRVALSWVGHWAYPTYSAALGDDLVLIPLPDLGNGTKSGQGSWAWAVGSGTAHPAEAASLVDWLTDDTNAAATAAANGAVPGTVTALARSDLYGPGKPLQMLGDQLTHSCGTGPVTADCVTVPRTISPGYPTITAAFSTAVLAAVHGEDPQQVLSEAARTIDAAVEANDGYTREAPTP